MNEILLQIAREHLDLETLETRRMDGLDFSDQAVWSLKSALEAAYHAGRKSARVPVRGSIFPDGAETVGAIL